MIIRPIDETTKPFALAISIHPEQTQFVPKIQETLAKQTHTEHPCVICLNEDADSVIGFFLFDIKYTSQYDFANDNDLGLRSVLIDQAYQGKGLGHESMRAITLFAQSHYPDFSHLCLTVNKQNLAAYRCYTKAGFEDKHQLYLGGNAGPQHILRLALER